MKLKLVEDDGWYTIEKADHENVHRIDWEGTSGSLFYSGRVSDADVGGPADQMLGIAQAILAKGDYAAKRCAVEVSEDGLTASFESPRNSQRPGVVPYADAEALAHEIIAALEPSDER